MKGECEKCHREFLVEKERSEQFILTRGNIRKICFLEAGICEFNNRE